MKPSCVLTGHFVPPPGRDPWTGLRHDYSPNENFQEQWVRWNRACFGANSASRVLSPEGRIKAIINNFRFLNFSISPALLDELRQTSPNVYRRLKEADAYSVARWGHGNAMARPWTETILPLLTRDEATLQIDWGLAAFRRHFEREAEGFCLPADAVNPLVLDLLVERGIRFILLSPFQAEGTMPIGSGSWQSLAGAPAPADRAFRIDRPGGSLAVFFPDLGLSRGLVNDHLLRDAHRFDEVLRKAVQTGFTSLSVRGETFGLDEPFADMCLAALWDRLAVEPAVEATNYGWLLETRPPTELVKLGKGEDERGTSGVCPHGVGRWHRDCGCRETPSHQAWKAPLRSVMTGWAQTLTAQIDLTAASKGLSPQKFRSWALAFLLEEAPSPDPNLAAAARGLHWLQSFLASALWEGDDPTSPGFRTGLLPALRAFDFVGPGVPAFVESLSAITINDGRRLSEFVSVELLRRRHDERFGAALFLLDRLLRPRARYQDSLGSFSVTAFSHSRHTIDEGVYRYSGQIRLYDGSTDTEPEFEYLLLEDHREGVSLFLKHASDPGKPEAFDLEDLPVGERAEIVHLMGTDFEEHLASETQVLFPLLRKSVVYARLLDVPPLPIARSLMELAVTRKILAMTENAGVPGPEVLTELEEELAFALDFGLTLDSGRLNERFSRWLAQTLADPESFISESVVDSVELLLVSLGKWGMAPDLTVGQALVYEALGQRAPNLLDAAADDPAALAGLTRLIKLANLLWIDTVNLASRLPAPVSELPES